MNEKIIGKKVRQIRTNRELTLKDLAKKTGLTVGYLSRIENSESAPPMGTLSRIAQELNTDLSYLLLQENESANKNPSIVVVKKDASEIGESSSNFHQNIVQGYDFEPLAREKRGKNMQPYILIPDFESAETIHHEAEEFIYILKGKIEFFYGTEKYVLAAGDCAYFDSDTPHSGRSVGKEKAKVLVILYSYKRL